MGTPGTKEMSKLQQIAIGKENLKLNTFSKENGHPTLPGRETAEFFLQKHFPSSTPTEAVRYTHKSIYTNSLRDRYCEWISIEKIRKSLGGFEIKKSPGPDGLKPVIFGYLPDNILQVLQIVFKSLIALAYTPVLWKETSVIFIPKPGKDDYSLPGSFRPISLSNYFLKGLERLAVWKMEEALVTSLVHMNQHGFRSDRSTETAISAVTDYVEKHIMNKQHCVGIFLSLIHI